jgi:superfamily II DNA or RNA helicase
MRQKGKSMRPAPTLSGREKDAALTWRERIDKVKMVLADEETERDPRNQRTAYFVFDFDETRKAGQVVIQFAHRDHFLSGSLGALKIQAISPDDLKLYSDARDRDLLSSLMLFSKSESKNVGFGFQNSYEKAGFSKAVIPPDLQNQLLLKMTSTERLIYPMDLSRNREAPRQLKYDPEQNWTFEIGVADSGDVYEAEGFFRHGDDRRSASEPKCCLSSGLLVLEDLIVPFSPSKHAGWANAFYSQAKIQIPKADGDAFVQAVFETAEAPLVSWPPSIAWEQVRLTPQPSVVISLPSDGMTTRALHCTLEFTYGAKKIQWHDSRGWLVDADARCIYLRDTAAEEAAFQQLRQQQGIEHSAYRNMGGTPLRILNADLNALIAVLLQWGWPIEATGRTVVGSKSMRFAVSSGTDWFDLNGSADFGGGHTVQLPELLSAVEAGEIFVNLGSGVVGMIPVEWQKRLVLLGAMGGRVDKKTRGLRFGRSQGALLTEWLRSEKSLTSDRGYEQLSKSLQAMTNIESISPGKTFHGKLRSYQKYGLGWLETLRGLSLGGILADDMGLGKTVQVLAHLDAEKNRMKGEDHRPSLIVLPKSLMFNWLDEAKKFTPSLKVVSYAGSDRAELIEQIPSADLVLITYGTLRQDLEKLQEFEFHYVIVDEAQAIKNASSLSHKTCCQIEGRYRLAMTGTPVENSIQDLFSILSFTNPGLLGPGTQKKFGQMDAGESSEDRQLYNLSRALKPFILRRSKDQVLKDLPPKTEQILYCELSPEEKQNYDALKDYYRGSLVGQIADKGLAKSKIMVLEALLRLRQAACHPGLVDKQFSHVESTKTEMLIEQLQELISEGHKALVFSQFTQFLGIVKQSLDRAGVGYEYLDGRVSAAARKERVQRFQEGNTNSVFLISLKAGGVGLNLTAADYVFVLDPWWNPAVEAQAIDRTHRIGQKRNVMAYRMIAKDTIEEKILELQKSKRKLASSLVESDSSLLRNLSLADIEMLLT